jgi:serine/threonine protein phosphatase PrpC
VCSNVGDSRCVLGTKSKVIAFTEDHKPSNEEEKERIEKAGGFVRFDRVNGELAMSRAIGDFRYKLNLQLAVHEHQVIAIPDIAIHERNHDEDEVLILACDGVWDVLSNEEAIQYVTNIVLMNDSKEKDEKGSNSSDEDDDEESNGSPIPENSSEDSNGNGNGKGVGFNLRKRVYKNGSSDQITSQEAAESLIDLALKDGSTDNISAIVVRFTSSSKSSSTSPSSEVSGN